MRRLGKMMIAALAVLLLAAALTGCASKEKKIAEQLQLGQKYLTELNYEEAIVAFQKVIELDPKNIEAYTGVISAYHQSGDEENAAAYAAQGVELFAEAGPDTDAAKLDAFYTQAGTVFAVQEEMEAFVELYELWKAQGLELPEFAVFVDSYRDALRDFFIGKADEALKAGDTDTTLENLDRALEFGEDENLEIRKQAVENGGVYEAENGDRYDAFGRQTRSTHYDGDGQMMLYTETEYDSGGNEISISSYWPDGTLIDTFTDFQYDEEGRILKSWTLALGSRDSGDESVGHFDAMEFEYEDGRMVKEIGPYGYTALTYDENGRHIRSDEYAEDGTFTGYMEWTYDENGNPYKYSQYDADGSLLNYHINEYDADGNRIRSTDYDASGNVVGITE